MQEQQKNDMGLIKKMAHELGLSPMDIFSHWLKTGEIKSLVLTVTYKDGNRQEINISNLGIEKNLVLEAPVRASQTVREKVPSRHPPKDEDETQTPKAQTPEPEHSTSIKHGRICIKKEQDDFVRLGAYVYTSGDVLPHDKPLPHVNVRGIVLARTEGGVTMVKHIGNSVSAVTSASQLKDGWRFLTCQECEEIARQKDVFNDSLGAKRKRIDPTSILIYKAEENELYGYCMATQRTYKTLTDKVFKKRIFAVFLAKDLQVV